MMKVERKMSGQVIKDLLKDTYFPPMYRVKQRFPRPRVEDIPARIRDLLSRSEISETVRPGMEIAITCGSRGIANISLIIRELCAFVADRGAKPFIIPAMGSHGGATAEGQQAILESYGVTETFCSAPIRSSMELTRIGMTEDGRDVLIDRHAAEADGIIVAGRVKPHTDFRGLYESGLMKMMVIGLGKHLGAEIFHQEGPRRMGTNLPMFGKAILKNAPILFGLAMIENAYDETARIEAIPAHRIADEEPVLLEDARSLMAQGYIKEVDLLIIDRIGKDISGDGMDPNITGRFSNPYVTGGMNAGKMAILDLTDESNGQMVGLGYGDVTTRRALAKCDFDASIPNALISTAFTPFRIPLVFDSDRDAIAACLKFNGEADQANPRVIRIRDTMHMDQILVSEALRDEVLQNPQMELIGDPEEFNFNQEGNLW